MSGTYRGHLRSTPAYFNELRTRRPRAASVISTPRTISFQTSSGVIVGLDAYDRLIFYVNLFSPKAIVHEYALSVLGRRARRPSIESVDRKRRATAYPTVSERTRGEMDLDFDRLLLDSPDDLHQKRSALMSDIPRNGMRFQEDSIPLGDIQRDSRRSEDRER